MFTGLIEELGKVSRLTKGKDSAKIMISAKKVLEKTKIGDSIAVNGICLTVTSLESSAFCADIMHETLNRSSLGNLNLGEVVNLERAMALDGRFGGHIVTGHIDGLGSISEIKKDDIAHWYTITAAPNLLEEIVEKGSITIDGISLTVARVSATSFSVSAIPHTLNQTTLQVKRVGDSVNIETDILAKYVKKLVMIEKKPKQEKLSVEFLNRHGF